MSDGPRQTKKCNSEQTTKKYRRSLFDCIRVEEIRKFSQNIYIPNKMIKSFKEFNILTAFLLSVTLLVAVPSLVASQDLTENKTTVEMINGDKVVINSQGDSTDYQIVPSSNGGTTYKEVIDGKDLYLIPQSLDREKYDDELFNISRLSNIQQKGNLSVIYKLGDKLPPVSVYRNTSVESYSQDLGLAHLHQTSGQNIVSTADKISAEKVWLDRKAKVNLYNSSGEIQAESVRSEYGYSGSGINVSVIDTGINDSHPDLDDSVIIEKNFANSDTVSDVNGHGTHVAGIISGDGTNSNGSVRGIAPEANLFNMKALDDDGSGRYSSIVDAISSSVENDADVISMSLGAPVDTDNPINHAVEEARDEGVIVVTSAGNSGPQYNTITAPGNSQSAITVGSDDTLNRRYSEDVAMFSSRGPTSSHQIKPSVLSPGVNIKSADAMGNSNYQKLSGTSMSAPHVSGLVAILLQSGISTSEVKTSIVNTADRAQTDANQDTDANVYNSGAGQVNASAAIHSNLRFSDAVLDEFNFSETENYNRTDTQTIEILNRGESVVNISNFSHNLKHIGSQKTANYTVSLSRHTIEPNQSGQIKFSITADSEPQGLYSGYLKFDTKEVSYNVPVGYVQPSTPDEVVKVKKIPFNNRDVSGEKVSVIDTSGEDVRVLENALTLNKNGVSYFNPTNNGTYKFLSFETFKPGSNPDAVSASALVKNISNAKNVLLDERNGTYNNITLSNVTNDTSELFNVELRGSIKTISQRDSGSRYEYSNGYIAAGSVANYLSGEIYVSAPEKDDMNELSDSIYNTVERTTQPNETRDELQNWGIDNKDVYRVYSFSKGDISDESNTYNKENFTSIKSSYYFNSENDTYTDSGRSIYRNNMNHISDFIDEAFRTRATMSFEIGDRKNQTIYYNKGRDNTVQMDFIADYRGTRNGAWYQIKSTDEINLKNPDTSSVKHNKPIKTSSIYKHSISKRSIKQTGGFYMNPRDISFLSNPARNFGSYKIYVNDEVVEYSDDPNNPRLYVAEHQTINNLDAGDKIKIKTESRSLSPISTIDTLYRVTYDKEDNSVPEIDSISIPAINQSNVVRHNGIINGEIKVDSNTNQDLENLRVEYKYNKSDWKKGDISTISGNRNFQFQLDLTRQYKIKNFTLRVKSQNSLGNSVNMTIYDIGDRWILKQEQISDVTLDDRSLPTSINTDASANLELQLLNANESIKTVKLNVTIRNKSESLTRQKQVDVSQGGEKIVSFENITDSIVSVGTYDLIVTDNRGNKVKENVTVVDPISGGLPPLDDNDDGKLEDIDGDGRVSIFDVQVFFENFKSKDVQQNTQFYDFNRDGNVNIIDVQELFEYLDFT